MDLRVKHEDDSVGMDSSHTFSMALEGVERPHSPFLVMPDLIGHP